MWKFLSFSVGIGFSIRGGGMGAGVGVLAISVLGGMCNCIGKWSELRLLFLFVVDMY